MWPSEWVGENMRPGEAIASKNWCPISFSYKIRLFIFSAWFYQGLPTGATLDGDPVFPFPLFLSKWITFQVFLMNLHFYMYSPEYSVLNPLLSLPCFSYSETLRKVVRFFKRVKKISNHLFIVISPFYSWFGSFVFVIPIFDSQSDDGQSNTWKRNSAIFISIELPFISHLTHKYDNKDSTDIVDWDSTTF